MEGGASVILLGLFLGIQHATDPDHVVAVATIVSRTRRFGSGAAIGALWAVGHTATVAAAGVAAVLFRVTITPAVEGALEAAVAVMLVALGGLRIAAVFRGSEPVPPAHLLDLHAHGGPAAFHTHAHAHGGVVHRHPHLHPPGRLLRALRAVGPGQALRSVAVGVVHGLAGSAALALLVGSTIQSPTGAVAYLLVFGAGTMAGMTAITALLALPFVWPALRLGRWRRALAVGTGLCSLGFGLYLALRLGLADGRLGG